MRILIVNGANLNLLGRREPEIYGTISMETVMNQLEEKFPAHTLLYFQSNHEGDIIDRLQQDDFDAVVINPGAFTHYSYAIADCLQNITKPKIEVHISNVYQRESFRQKSVTAAYTNGIVAGFGTKSYELALISIVNQ